MARPKSFDVDEVLDRAVDLFWVHGFAATSMEDLVSHLGINRGSLYATFGSKQELYARALERYSDQNLAWLTDLFADPDTPLRSSLATMLASAAEAGDHRGCLLMNAATERNAADDACRAQSSAAMEATRAALATALSERSGELADGVTPEQGADLMLVAMQGLRVLSTTTADVGSDHTTDTILDAIAPLNRG